MRFLPQVRVLKGSIDLIIEPLLMVGFLKKINDLKKKFLAQMGIQRSAHLVRGVLSISETSF